VESQDGSISLDRAGSLIVEFAPVAPGSGTNVGNRSYQWDKKQVPFRNFHVSVALKWGRPCSKSHLDGLLLFPFCDYRHLP
jgi:hypothetical protein